MPSESVSVVEAMAASYREREIAAQPARHHRKRKLGPMDFDILKVIGQGGYGKVGGTSPAPLLSSVPPSWTPAGSALLCSTPPRPAVAGAHGLPQWPAGARRAKADRGGERKWTDTRAIAACACPSPFFSLGRASAAASHARLCLWPAGVPGEEARRLRLGRDLRHEGPEEGALLRGGACA